MVGGRACASQRKQAGGPYDVALSLPEARTPCHGGGQHVFQEQVKLCLGALVGELVQKLAHVVRLDHLVGERYQKELALRWKEKGGGKRKGEERERGRRSNAGNQRQWQRQ